MALLADGSLCHHTYSNTEDLPAHVALFEVGDFHTALAGAVRK
jgi:hypothetical protein